jgi:hypothetical protein
MPVQEADPWRLQYFAGVPCPNHVIVPTEDADAYRLFPAFRWVYNKLLLAESQGVACGPHGVEPAVYPAFSKPIVNLRGMGIGSRVLRSRREYLDHQQPGHMWMELFTGEHVSTDIAAVAGQPRWWRHAVGRAAGHGTFDYWTILAEPRPDIERYCAAWLQGNLPGYTGMVNIETIGGRIIEIHLRFSDQWPDLYGPGWVASVIGLYAEGVWRFADTRRRDGHSVVLFGPHGRRYRHPDRALVQAILREPAIASVQLTFHEDRPAETHAMPPGGFRLAVVNCWDLAAGLAQRRRLAEALAVSQEPAKLAAVGPARREHR